MSMSMSSRSASSSKAAVDPGLLAKAWTPQIVQLHDNDDSFSNKDTSSSSSSRSSIMICQAMERTLPLLEDVASVPFVCRYRTDVIHPLTTRQVHFLQSLISKHASLATLRTKLLNAILVNNGNNNNNNSSSSSSSSSNNNDNHIMKERIQTSTSKTELEDWYAPFKPPSKGSILERIQKEHPKLVEAVDQLWENNNGNLNSITKLGPRESLIHLLSSKIAAEPKISTSVHEELQKHCRVLTTSKDPKYQNYNDFSGHLVYLKDHQVLAIRRGMQQKVVKMSFDNIDGSKMEGCIKYHLRNIAPRQLLSLSSNNHNHNNHNHMFDDAVHDAWTRLLRRRGTTRLWGDKCKEAQERACQVFEDNLHRALLAPPRLPSSTVLCLDPGFQAGIKCAILDPDGTPLRLDTVKFLGDSQRKKGIQQLEELLAGAQTVKDYKVLVAMGNGHGSQDCRQLIGEASESCKIPIEIQLVNEAGASVWSVTEAAATEFPKQPAAAIASISIGRRLQNPLPELVKVPPRSLGLGMYQHDLSEKELDEKLHLTSVDAVATVGVDINSCSLEILRKVPGLPKLAEKIIKARPLKQRGDLLKVSGLGPKTFENCAAFCRVSGTEPLDATLVHPESYEMARWLLKTFSWNLEDPPADMHPRKEWKTSWKDPIAKAAKKFGVSEDRTFAVIENLVDSMLKVDPRLRESEEGPATSSTTTSASAGGIDGCSLLSPDLAEMGKLATATPVRKILGTVRNIADFGAFIDFGGHNDGLLHTSKLGPVKLSNLLIGQQLGVDILSASDGKVSLSIAGLNFEPDTRNTITKHRGSKSKKGDSRLGKKRQVSTKARTIGHHKGSKRQRTG